MSELCEIILTTIIWLWAIVTIIRMDIAIVKVENKPKAKGEQQ